jgi:NOL1/NOP2/sun family putative RNA methylase
MAWSRTLVVSREEANKRFFLDRYRMLGHRLTGDEKTPQTIRVNTIKSSDAEVLETLTSLGVKLTKIPYLDHGYVAEESGFSLGASIEYLLGLFSLQESASQFAAQTLAPNAGDTVIDMCAAPGGKTTQISAYMGNRGLLYAVDADRERIYALENNLERCGVMNSLVYHGDVNTLELGTQFSKVLLDAPCSGNYVTDSNWFRKRSIEDVHRNAKYQRGLLSTAMRYLEPGGVLLYATCSLEPEENELNMEWLLSNHEAFLEEIDGPGEKGLTEVFGQKLDVEISKCHRFWPNTMQSQGFFLAKVVKR